jgi:hypothetical protein
MPGRIRPGLIGALVCAILFAGIHPVYAQSQSVTKSQQKMEGWANVPGGTVWLNPGTQAYEHDTGLVRDLRTGQKSLPITPQSLQVPSTPQVYWQSPQQIPQQVPFCAPCQPVQPLNPLAINPLYPIYPVPRTYNPRPWYDLGPNDVYAPSLARPGSGYGAKVDARGSINSRWKATQLPK